MLTNQCVAASSKDASFRDFKPIVIEECTGTTLPHLQEPAIEMMRVGWCEVRDLESTLGEIRQLAPVSGQNDFSKMTGGKPPNLKNDLKGPSP